MQTSIREFSMLDALAGSIFASLKEMDDVAGPTPTGKRTGLWWFGGHAEPHRKRPRTEPCWSSHLAVRLTAAGWPSLCEQKYPERRRQRCDVVTTLPCGTQLWLELKGAWKEWWRQRGQERVYSSYLLGDRNLPRSHTAVKDLDKLDALPPGRWIGFLLIGFDSAEHPMDQDVKHLVAMTRLAASPWRHWQRDWRDRQEPTERVRLWLWIRPPVLSISPSEA